MVLAWVFPTWRFSGIRDHPKGSQTPMRFWMPRRSWCLLPLCLACLAGCSSLKGRFLESQGDQAFELAHYSQAVDFYQQVKKLRPGDKDIRRKLEIARTALFYARGKDAYFQEDFAQAERWFRLILRRHPDQELAKAWLREVRKKQAQAMVAKARDLAAWGHDQEAMDLLARSLRILPHNPEALSLRSRLRKERRKLLERGKALVKAGLEILRESLGEEGDFLAFYNLEGARRLMGKDFQVPWVLKELERRFLARAKKEIRAALEKDDYARALFMARYARTFFPDRGEFKIFEKEAKDELEAQILAGQAQNMLLRGNPDKAEEFFKEAARLSRRRSGIYLAGLEEVRDARLALAYEEARDFENRGLYEEALARYKKIAARAPDYRDVEAWVRDLEASLRQGRKLLDRARSLAARGKKKEALQALRELFSLLPFYKEGLELKFRILGEEDPVSGG